MYPHYNQRNGLPVTTVPLNISMINANKTPFYQPQMVMAVPVSPIQTIIILKFLNGVEVQVFLNIML